MAVSKKFHWAYLDRNSRIKAVVFFKQWQDNAEVPCHRKDLRVERDLGFARDKLPFIIPSHPSPSHQPLFFLLCFPLLLCFLIHSFLLQTCISPMFQSLMKRGAHSCLHIRLHVGNTWIERERIGRLWGSDSQSRLQLESRGNLKKKKNSARDASQTIKSEFLENSGWVFQDSEPLLPMENGKGMRSLRNRFREPSDVPNLPVFPADRQTTSNTNINWLS